MTTTPDTPTVELVDGVTWHLRGERHLPDWGDWYWAPDDSVLDIRYCRAYRCGLFDERAHIDGTPTYEAAMTALAASTEVVAETRVAGASVDPFAVTVCRHESHTFQPVIVNLVDDGSGKRTGHQLQLKVRCGQCSARITFDVASARLADDGYTLGVFLVPFEGE